MTLGFPRRVRFGRQFLLAAAALVCFSPGLRAEQVELLSPINGTRLPGGSIARIAWDSPAPLPARAEEWEAFLSVDGGNYYSTRITPHLDIQRRSFEWRVPNINSRSARLLVRFGNEEEESIFELPVRFSIDASSDVFDFPATSFSASFSASFRESRGESARPGDPAVVEWTNGPRDGTGATVARSREGLRLSAPPCFAAGIDRSITSSQDHTRVPPRGPITSLHSGVASPAPTRPASIARDILLISTRLNV